MNKILQFPKTTIRREETTMAVGNYLDMGLVVLTSGFMSDTQALSIFNRAETLYDKLVANELFLSELCGVEKITRIISNFDEILENVYSVAFDENFLSDVDAQFLCDLSDWCGSVEGILKLVREWNEV